MWYGSLNKTYHVVFIKHMHFILDKAREWQGVINSHKSIAIIVRKDTDRHIKTIKQSKQWWPYVAIIISNNQRDVLHTNIEIGMEHIKIDTG